ncbi:hypothetical protein pipiens_017159 [Culex pipiens pipiens]|uniref:Uncharacterized protein n=1 Tax=Culex pipiens pipiens TaxID=38569 RepID=A0ABD1CHW8_CULPP
MQLGWLNACAVDLPDAKVEETKKEPFRKRLNEDTKMDEIVMAISNDVLNYIIGASCAKEAMDILIREFQTERIVATTLYHAYCGTSIACCWTEH